MTREEAKHWLEIELKTWEDECKSKHPIKEAFSVAIETLDQYPILDKVRAEIDTARFVDKETRLCENANASGLKAALEIIDKYRAESEE